MAVGYPRGTVRGAYGFAITGAENAASFLVRAPRDWPILDVIRREGRTDQTPISVGDERADVPLIGGGSLVIRRRGLRAVYTTPHALSDAELVHPYLAPAAAVAARWCGRESFHAGGLVVDGGVWAIVGEKGGGKSSLLAWLALRGHEIFTDDALVIDGRVAYAGPRSIDLRPDAAEALRAGEGIGRIGERERWRLALAQTPSTLTFRGWVFLEWAERVEVAPVPVRERLARLARHRMVKLPPIDPETPIALATLPTTVLRRPKTWDDLESVEGRLLSSLA